MNNATAESDVQTETGADGLIYGLGSPISDVKRSCERIAISDATVLLTGETGTGKEVFARFVHGRSGRRGRAFVPVNCGAIPETLLESELFGYVKGAFTGAANVRRGRVALAEGGTLFLDEIGELPLPLQVKLLRLLQERTYEPVGSSESVTANFRLVAATNRDLFSEVRAGRFRRDLFYRLNVCPVRLPALRERRGDIETLFSHFWARRGERRPLEPGVMARLGAYQWPGNVRELENVVERLSVCTEGATIRNSDVEQTLLPDDELASLGTVAPSLGAPPVAAAPVASEPAPAPGPSPSPPGAGARASVVSLSDYRGEAPVAGAAAGEVRIEGVGTIKLPVDMPKLLRTLEDSLIRAALDQAGGSRKGAATLLGMGRTTLVEKIRRRGEPPAL
jgi:sigma-54 specific flagellar transcriptional regulator A